MELYAYNAAGRGLDMSELQNGDGTFISTEQYIISNTGWVDFNTEWALGYTVSDGPVKYGYIEISTVSGGYIIDTIVYSNTAGFETLAYYNANIFVSAFDANFGGNIWDVSLFNGDDIIAGNDYRDTIKAGRRDDTVFGNGGSDNLYGEDGNDILSGGAGRDKLFGGNGADVLAGGKGNDKLRGEGGVDYFVFEKGGGRDVALDFQPGIDFVQVEGSQKFVRKAEMIEVNDGVLLKSGKTSLLLVGVEEEDLSVSDFLF